MAMPISKSHLRVPLGFGALLEGLTREILRDQPKDIPKYAAEYFETLLKTREESGTDPSVWAAKLEDRYDSNQAYKPSELASKLTVNNKTSNDSMAEDYSAQSEGDASTATNKTIPADDAHLTKSEEEESSPIITRAESAGGPSVASADPKASTHGQSEGLSNEINNSAASSQNNSYSERLDIKLLTDAAVDTQGSRSTSEDGDCQLSDREEDKPGSVNICAAVLEEETAGAVSTMEEDTEQEEALQSTEMMPESPEITEQKPEKAREANVDAPTDAVLDDNQDEALVEIDFEDVPGNQEATDNENEPNMDTKDEVDDDITQHQHQVELGNEGQADEKEEINSNHDNNREESDDTGKEHQHTTNDDHVEGEHIDDVDNVNSNQDTFGNNFDINNDTTDSDDNKTEVVQEIEQKSAEIDAEIDETQVVDSNMKIMENNFDFINDTTDLDDTKTEVVPEIGQKSAENDTENYAEIDETQVVDSNTKTTEKDEGDVSEDDEEQQQEGSLDRYLPNELHSDKEEDEEQVKSDSEDKAGLFSHELDNVDLDLEEARAEEGDTSLLENHPDPEGDTNDKQEECSRPQEEEDIMDIPLDDPEANRAAAKIQAGFRGHMTRKKMKPEDKTEGEEVSSTGEVLSSSQGGTETGGSRPVGGDDTAVPEQ